MNVMKLMVVTLAGWINQQQEDVTDCSTAGSGLADCFATTPGMSHETDDSNFWTLRDGLHWEWHENSRKKYEDGQYWNSSGEEVETSEEALK